MASATPGGAPGYDYDKEFGNNVAHSTARTFQRLRGYTARSPEVKGRTPLARFWQSNCVPGFRGLGFLCVQAGGETCSPGGAKRNPGAGSRGEITDCAKLHPGYGR